MRGEKAINRLLFEAESLVDWARYRLRKRRGNGPFQLVPFRGHGTRETLYLKGRVLEGEPVPPADERDSAWRNLVHTLRRLETDEVPAARVRARIGDGVWDALANGEGYFDLRMEVHTPATEIQVWRPVGLELIDPVAGAPVRATGFVLVPPAQARFGVISDIDDTVVQTGVTNLLRMLRLVFLTNAHTRLPFEGVAAFYRALQRGEAGESTNPIFYVSSSPWNLYNLLHEVFEVHGIPAGPLLLKDYGLSRGAFLGEGHREHKLRAIEHILTTHPDLSFVLLGDSGQKDPEIYREVVEKFPGRVRVIYIRNVSVGRTREAEVRAIAADVARHGVEMVFTVDTVSAALHAAALDLIDIASLDEIRGEKARDEAAPGPLESVVRG